MIASFFHVSKYAEKHINFIYRNENDTFKEPLYHKSVEQLNSIKGIKGIIIPAQKELNEPVNYDPKVLIEHIRLLEDRNLSSLPIYIVNASDKIIDELELHLDFGIDVSQTEDIDFESLEKLSEKRLNRVIDLIANDNDGRSRHNQSNEWGSYRLISSLNHVKSDKNSIINIRESLSESLYYKKLLLNESFEERSELNSIQKGDFLKKLSFINENINKVAIIDDMINMGWREAYANMLNIPKVEYFDQHEVVFSPEDSEKFDLIILDLRLEEEVGGDSNDVLGVDNLSGIILLKKIKAHDPSVPVIISTASNKSWSLESANNYGADGFWSKEDPQRGLSFEYRFKNTYNLIFTLYNVIKWSKKVRCVYTALMEIHKQLSLVNPLVAKSILKKTKVIFGQLHDSKSNFRKDFFGQSGLEVAFITVSSLINDIISYYREEIVDKNKNTSYFITIDTERHLFCDKKYNGGKIKFKIPNKVFEELKYEVNKTVNGKTITEVREPKYNENFFPEKSFMNYLLIKMGMEEMKSRYSYYSSLRNKIDMIHGKPIIEDIDSETYQIKIEDLYRILEIFYQAFLQKSCKYFPEKKKSLRR